MRIIITTTPNTIPVPFNYQEKMVGMIHKWIGACNQYHDSMSLYSFSWLKRGFAINSALNFPRGACFFINFLDENVIKLIMGAILSDPEMFCGMSVKSITLGRNPNFSKREIFYCASPIFIKERLANGIYKQYTFYDANASQLLKETIKNKMRLAGFDEDETLEIQFKTSYVGKKTKLVHYHGIANKSSLCPVIIKGKPSTMAFIWNVGLGNSTGIGFGSIY